MTSSTIFWPTSIPTSPCRMNTWNNSSSSSLLRMRKIFTTIKIYLMQWLPFSSRTIRWRNAATIYSLHGFKRLERSRTSEVVHFRTKERRKIRIKVSQTSQEEQFLPLKLIQNLLMLSMKTSMIWSCRCSRRVLMKWPMEPQDLSIPIITKIKFKWTAQIIL